MIVEVDRLESVIRRRGHLTRDVIIAGIRAAMIRGNRILARRMPKDLLRLRDSWQVKNINANNIVGILINAAPYAGTIEAGARPHIVSRAGRRRIVEWGMRKLKLDEDGATRMMFTIVKRLREKGQPGHFFVLKKLPRLNGVLKNEVDKHIKAARNAVR